MQEQTDPRANPRPARRFKSMHIFATLVCVAAVLLSARFIQTGERQNTAPSIALAPSATAVQTSIPGPTSIFEPTHSTNSLFLPKQDAGAGLAADPRLFSGPGSYGVNGAARTPGSNADAASVIERLRAQIKANPKDVNSRVTMLMRLDLSGRTSEAEDVIRQALKEGQRHPKLYQALGTLYMRHKLYDGAAEVFLCQVKLTPNDPEATVRLAECYSLVGLRERAKMYFDKTLKLNPNEPNAYIGLAFLNSSNQRSPFAIKYLRKYIALSKEPGQGYLLLSRIYVNQNRHEEAIDAGLKGIAAMPESSEMWYNLGQAYAYSRGDKLLDKAEEAFKKVIQLAPENGHGHFELGRLYAKLGRADEAAARYAEAVRCEPLNGRYHYQHGRALVQANRKTEAEPELSRARELLPLNQREEHLRDRLAAVPKDANAWCELGGIYVKYGNRNLAVSCADKALEFSPGLTAALALKRELEPANGSPVPKQ